MTDNMKQIEILKAQRDAWKEVAENQYGLLRISMYGGSAGDYPVKGALDAWAAGRHPVLRQPAPIIPDGYEIMPTQLTAENGAKAALIGEFSTAYIGPCSLCEDLEASEDCEECAGAGKSMKKKIIDWTTIKAIYSAAVRHFTLAH